MLVKNVEPRLIRIGGEFIAPDQVVEIDDQAVGLAAFLARGVLLEVKADNHAKDEKKPKTPKGE